MTKKSHAILSLFKIQDAPAPPLIHQSLQLPGLIPKQSSNGLQFQELPSIKSSVPKDWNSANKEKSRLLL